MFRLQLPNDSDRLTIIGPTGSGKTRAGVWHLSLRSWRVMPWIAIDFKGDDLLERVPFRDELTLSSRIPHKPGLYIVRPHPDDVEELEQFYRRVWEKRRCGLYIDEAYMINPRSRAFNGILTQGRSLKIPIIACVQKPTWISRYFISEAQYFQYFPLTDKDDKKRISDFANINSIKELPRFYSLWYDVRQRDGSVWRPVPSDDLILANFQSEGRQVRVI